MLPRLAAGLSAALLLLTPAFVSASSAALPAVQAASAVPGSQPLLLAQAVDLGPAPTAVRQTVVLSLKLRDDAGLARLLKAQQNEGSADYHRWLTPAQFADRFSPRTSVVAEVTGWAKAAGLTVTEVSPNRTLVTLGATRAQLNRAFAVRLHGYRLAGQTYVTPNRTASLPARLRTALGSVLGLTTYNPNRVHHRLATTAAKTAGATGATTAAGYRPYASGGYSPRDFHVVYNAPATTSGANQTAAIITDGNLSQVKRDLSQFEERFELRRVPLTVVETTQPSNDTTNNIEYDLDSQATLGFAPGIKRLIAYNAGALGDIHPLNQFVVERRSLTASASYGGCELLNAMFGFVAAGDQVFKQAMAQGQTFWFSTGDDGSGCPLLFTTGTPAAVPNVEYPASSPYVVAVGGTTLTGQTVQPAREITWIGAGGGYSAVESAPPWQKSAGAFERSLGRGLPDVSLDADPNSGFTVIVAGMAEIVGGTSASAPAWNGIWARVLQRHPRIGFAAPALYRLPPGALVDITLGTNGLHAATPGYDLSTGLGTPNITRLVALAR